MNIEAGNSYNILDSSTTYIMVNIYQAPMAFEELETESRNLIDGKITAFTNQIQTDIFPSLAVIIILFVMSIFWFFVYN